MPGPIDKTPAAATIAALMRRALSRQPQSDPSPLRPGPGRSPVAGEPMHQASVPELATLIAARIQELPPDGIRDRTRLLRVVIEATLLNAFGSTLVNSPKFQAVVDRVVDELQAEPRIQEDIDQALAELRPPPDR